MKIRHPNFLVAGAQKCGTSYLCAILAQHPQVFHTNPKEPLFFQRADVGVETFERYIVEHYTAAANQPLVGEGSTVYFQWPNALENIKTHLGDEIKVIICLRHPTDRALSFYLHNVKKGRLNGTERICDVGKDVRDSPVLSSMYATHLLRWLDCYGDRVKVLVFDDLLLSPSTFVEQATAFLGVKSLGEVKKKAVNKGFGLEWKRERLTSTETFVDRPTPSFTRWELEDLHSLFIDDVEATEKVLQVNLPSWKRMPQFTAKQSGW